MAYKKIEQFKIEHTFVPVDCREKKERTRRLFNLLLIGAKRLTKAEASERAVGSGGVRNT